MNTVTFGLDASDPANKGKYEAIGDILFGKGTKVSATAKETTKASTADTSSPADGASAVAEEEASTSSTNTIKEVRAALKVAKEEHGQEFCVAVMNDSGECEGTRLGTMIKELNEANFSSVIADLQAGPPADDADEDDGLGHEDVSGDDDDDLEGDDAEEELTDEAVKDAVRAFNKKNGKEKTKAHLKTMKCKNIAEISKLKPAKLAELFELVTS